MIVIELVLLGVVFLAASVPGWNFDLLMIGVLGCVAFAVAWIVWFLWLLTRAQPALRLTELAAWLLLPLIGFLGVAAVADDLPLRARFELSRTAFESAAKAPPSPSDWAPVHELGLYGVMDVPDRPGTRFFLVPEGGLLNEYGFAYRPLGPSADDLMSCQPLGGPWWYCVLGSSD